VRQGSVGYPAVSPVLGCPRPLRAWFAKPKWRSRTEIPPSPGKRMYQVPPISRPAGTGTGLVEEEEAEAGWPRALGTC